MRLFDGILNGIGIENLNPSVLDFYSCFVAVES